MKGHDELRQEHLAAVRRRLDATDRLVRRDVRAGGGPGHALWYRTKAEVEEAIDRAVVAAAGDEYDSSAVALLVIPPPRKSFPNVMPDDAPVGRV